MFIIAATIFFFGNLFYLIFGRMELQPWDDPNFLLPRSVADVKQPKEKSEKSMVDEKPNSVEPEKLASAST